MPEEKEKKEATPKLNSSNMDGKKKASFTFSDKIKNSKPAASKSFAKRSSSKIGSDGKPRQTLFERTKRDVPFFIAALVALLLLPFLYKYSGNVDEEPTLVTPGYEDSAFNPERSGFDGFAGNPEDQIAQLSGRDSMSLIRFGDKASEEEVDEEDYSLSRSAYAGEGSSASHRLDEQDEEENTTNIYKYRKKAPAATRAAFKRTATKINPLRGANRAGASGSRLGVGPWGGAMKSASRKVRSDGPQNAPKPVSLQPLQAAGKPSKSYYGNAASQEARRSKDAMSKGNAMQALMDSQMKPVDPGKIGGIFGGDFTGGGAGSDIKRELNFNGKEPWWWDLMKQRSQYDWQHKRDRMWQWRGFFDQLAQLFLGNLLKCIIMGNTDGDADTFFGTGGGSGGKEPTCCGIKAKDWDESTYGPFGKDSCDRLKKRSNFDSSIRCTKDKWWDAGYSGTGGRQNWWKVRLNCLGAHFSGSRDRSQDGKIQAVDCDTFYSKGYYSTDVGGKSGKYTVYHYVVGIPFNKVKDYFRSNNPAERRKMLQIAYMKEGNSFNVDDAEARQKIHQRKFVPLFIESVAIKSNKLGRQRSDHANGSFAVFGDDPDELNVTENTGVNYDTFLQRLQYKSGGIVISDEEGGSLLSTKGTKRWSTGGRCAYPLAFISCRNHALALAGGTTPADGETVPSTTGSTLGSPAAFIRMPNLISSVNEAAGANNEQLDTLKKHFSVMYEIGENGMQATNLSTGTALNTSRNVLFFANIHSSNEIYPDPSRVSQDGGTPFSTDKDSYLVKVSGQAQRQLEAMFAPTTAGATAPNDRRAVITWTVQQDWNEAEPWAIGNSVANGHLIDGGVVRTSGAAGQIVSQATCVYFDEGSTFVVHDKPCKNKDESPKCCQELHPREWGMEYGKDYVYVNGKCVRLQIECTNMHQSAECCDKMHPREWGNNYRYNQQTNKCEQTNIPHKDLVYFAPVISWVPNGKWDRIPKTESTERLTKKHFPTRERYIPPAENDENNPPYQKCGDQKPIVMDSKAALDFVHYVADKYNDQPEVKSGEKNPISKELTNAYPTDGEFIDALQIAQKLGIHEVPSSAVCELARDYVRMSRDKHAGHMEVPGSSQDFKHLDRRFRNDLGAFLIYVHWQSILYPNAKYEGVTTDCRFIPQGYRGTCTGIKPMGKAYHYNNYNGNNTYDKTRPYQASVEAIKKKYSGENARNFFPLSELVIGKPNYSAQCGNCGTRRDEYQKSYKLLLSDPEEAQGKHQACVAFTGSQKMSVDNALKYAKAACTIGLDAKPYGTGSSSYHQGQGPTTSDNAHPGSTTTVQGQ